MSLLAKILYLIGADLAVNAYVQRLLLSHIVAAYFTPDTLIGQRLFDESAPLCIGSIGCLRKEHGCQDGSSEG